MREPASFTTSGRPAVRYCSHIAKIYAAMGDVEKAFMWLETSYKEGNPDLIKLNSEPVFGGIRAEPRFGELMQRVGWKT